MTEYTKDEALAFIEAMRLTLKDKVGFKWMVDRLAGLSAFVEAIAIENERLSAYLSWAGAADQYEAYLATHPVAGTDEGPRVHSG